MSNKIGRPTKYEKKYCQKIIQFFNKNPYEIDLETGKEIPIDLPTFEKFAVSINVHRDTLHEWKKNYEEFSDAYKKAKDLQKHILIINGLRGNYNSIFAIFTAKNITDMKDIIENKNINLNKDLNNMTEEEVDKEIEKYEKMLKNEIR